MKIYDKITFDETEMTAEQVISAIVDDAVSYGEGSLEALTSKVDKLTQIVGILVKHLPPEALNEVVGRSYRFEIR